MGVNYKEIDGKQQENIVEFRFIVEDGEPGIQVRRGDGEWEYICFLDSSGKLQLVEVDSTYLRNLLQFDDDNFIVVER